MTETNGERELYLYMLSELITDTKPVRAIGLLREISMDAKKQNLAGAMCSYLSNFVIPKLQTGMIVDGSVPSWVDGLLFHPLEYGPREVDWSEWLGFFGSDTAYVRLDRKNGGVLMEGLPESREWALERKAGVHFIPQSMGKEPTPDHSTRRSSDNVLACNSLMVDFDGDKAEGWRRLALGPILPSLVVETLRGWHAYWPLEAPVSVSKWERIQSTMNDFYGSDTAIKYASHSLRMPSSWHCKGLFEGGEAFYVRLVHATWKRFRFEDMEIAFPPKPIPKRYIKDFQPIDGVRLPSTNALPKGASHDPLVSESGRVYAGVREENASAARNIVVSWFTSFKERRQPTDEKEAHIRCDELERKQYGRVVSR